MGAVRRLIGIGLAAAAVVAAGLMPGLPASAAPAVNGTYLALGDSLAFGFVPAEAAVPPPDHANANFFVGDPEDVGQALRLGVWNASCPGETTDSMLVAGAPSNGCEAGSSGFGGEACAAGLLIKLPDGTCDIHPSPAGHLLLAQAIEDVAGPLPPK